jgi:hypothetical protein
MTEPVARTPAGPARVRLVALGGASPLCIRPRQALAATALKIPSSSGNRPGPPTAAGYPFRIPT